MGDEADEEAPADADEAVSGATVADAADDAPCGPDGGSEDAPADVGLGVDDFAGEGTGQVAAVDSSVSAGCLVVAVVETLGTGVVETAGAELAGVAGSGIVEAGAEVAGVVEAGGAGVVEAGGTGARVADGGTLVTLGRALAVAVGTADGHARAVPWRDPVLGVPEAPGVLPGPPGAGPPGAGPLGGGVPCPVTTGCVPLASVPAVARCGPPPPCSAVPASMMASRSG